MEASGVIPMNNLRVIGKDMELAENSGAVRILESGIYLFIWHIPAGGDGDMNMIVTLESTDGETAYARSGAVYESERGSAVVVHGSAAANLTAGDEAVLRNRSGGALKIAALSGGGIDYSGSITVIRVH